MKRLLIQFCYWLVAKLSAKDEISFRFKCVNYGRTFEVGRFGRGPSGRIWVGWEVECAHGSQAYVLDMLRVKADETEAQERKAFAERTDGKHRGE